MEFQSNHGRMATPDPRVLTAPPPSDSAAGASSTVAPPAVSSSHTPPGESPAPDPLQVAALRAEMVRDRFDAAAARVGVDAAYVDVALSLFEKTGQEPTKDNIQRFCAELKTSKPALFGPQPASTAPVPASAVPAAPAPGGVSNPYQQWQALRAAGRTAEAQAFYMLHRGAITRTA